MKRIATLLLMVLALGFSLRAQNTVVKAKLSGFVQPQVYLFEVVGSKLSPQDTITPNSKGEFEMEFQMEAPTMYVLRFNVNRCNDIHLMLMPKEKINIEFELWNQYPFARIKSTKGSKNLTAYMEFNHTLSDSLAILRAIDDEFQKPATSDQRKMELGNRFQNIQIQQNLRIKRLIENNTDCVVSAFLVTYFEQDFVTYLPLYEAVRDGLQAQYANNPFVQHVTQKLATSLAAGMMAPEIEMKDPEGNTRKLSDLRGKVVMVDFWASWCRPCRQENPNVVRMYHKYHSAGFEIYSVSLDKGRTEWVKAIQDDGLVWPNHVSDLRGWTSSGGATYGITSVPSTVLIDRQGRIIAKNLRGPDLERKLQEIFGY